MNSDDHFNIAFLALAMILPLSALLSRRIPIRQSLKMAAIWAAILLIGVVIVGLTRDGVASSWDQLKTVLGNDEQRISGGTVKLRMAADGHYWANVTINGVAVHMLVDSGATTTSLSTETAKAARLDLNQNPIPVQIDTANGTILAHTSSADLLELGPIKATNLRVVVAEEFGATNVLGMNFLSRLKSWRMENGWLILEPKHP
jgi:aspartyl protease family protein